jgi:hypothetical protein
MSVTSVTSEICVVSSFLVNSDGPAGRQTLLGSSLVLSAGCRRAKAATGNGFRIPTNNALMSAARASLLAVAPLIEAAQQSRFFLVYQPGPTVFVLKVRIRY